MIKVHMSYSEIVVYVTADMKKQAWGEEELCSLERRVQDYKSKCVETFYEHRDSGR